MNDLIASFLRLADLGQEAGIVAGLVFFRVGAAMALLPGFGEASIPMRIRLAVTLALTMLVAPVVQGQASGISASDFWLQVPTEVFMGLLIGLSLRILVFALQIAGAIIAQATSLSQLFAMPASEAQPIASSILVVAGIALLMVAGLPVVAVEYIVLSYEIFGILAPSAVADGAAWAMARTAEAVRIGFTLALPFVIFSGLYNIMIGVLNRAMAQLMVSLIGAPALAFGTLLLMMVALPGGLQIWQKTAFSDPFQTGSVP